MTTKKIAFNQLKESLSKVEVQCEFIKGDNPYYSPIINGFNDLVKYEEHLYEQVQNLMNEIKMNLHKELSFMDYHHYLLELSVECDRISNLIYIKKNYDKEETEVFKHSLEFTNDHDILDGYVDHFDFEKRKSKFFEIQKKHIDIITQFLRKKIKVIEKNLSNSERIKIGQKIIPKLKWKRSKTDLLILILTLLESKSISNKEESLTRKDAIEIFGALFGEEMKNAESLISRHTGTQSKGEFFEFLKDAYNKYVDKTLEYKKKRE